ncbi:homoserine kinase [Spirulina subsalsa FACHB-351]|uniref:Homoserine kinase n=1 Tax=Spirulina subsalsa FACHB-351 TaxID=234711 RepID=A0ABT3L4W8_9CYAN|nr:homoserine kinase [Spirulina subsalsa]MCW6036525.1 homoserine kinase [Spirulina subsalsa FACHB-351]
MPLIAFATVPATTANLGPGFDCIGAALTLYNQFDFVLGSEFSSDPLKIKVVGSQSSQVSTDSSNLVYQAFAKFYEQLKQSPPPVEITVKLGVPLARGLGSSATAIVAGLLGANQLAGTPLSTRDIIELAIAMEGHPDNVVPAIQGGCRLSARQEDGQWQICEIAWHNTILPVVAVPNFTLSTEEARSVLPLEVSRRDAIFNVSHFGLLIKGLERGRGDWLKTALKDRIHQPYRQFLIPGYQVVEEAALAAGAYGLVISGAGPTLLALADAQQAKAVATAMTEAWNSQGIPAQSRVLALDAQGARSSREMRR